MTKKTAFIWAGVSVVLAITLVPIIFRSLSKPRSPECLFRKHIANEIPASVTRLGGTERHGINFGRGWVALVFDLAPEDSERIIASLGYERVPPEEIRHHLKAASPDFEVVEAYFSRRKGLKHFLGFNEGRTRAYYRYR